MDIPSWSIFLSFYSIFLLVVASADEITSTTPITTDATTNQVLEERALNNGSEINGDKVYHNKNSSSGEQLDVSKIFGNFIARRDGTQKKCAGSTGLVKFEIYPKGRSCEINVKQNNSEICWLEVELKDWNGECTRSWIEVENNLECGNLKGKRWLEIDSKGINLRAASDSGSLHFLQVPCMNSTKYKPLQTLMENKTGLSSNGNQKPFHFSSGDAAVTIDNNKDLVHPVNLLTEFDSGNDRLGHDPSFPEPEICKRYPERNCQDILNRLDSSQANLNSGRPNFPGFITNNSSNFQINGDHDRVERPPLSYAQYIPNSQQYYPGGSYPNPRESSLSISNPSYPEPSPPGDCFLDISLPPACSVLLRFNYFDVGSGDHSRLVCPNSWLEISGYRFCGCQTGLNWNPPPTNLVNGNMRFIFHGTGRFFIDLILIPNSPQSFRYSPRSAWQCQPNIYPATRLPPRDHQYPYNSNTYYPMPNRIPYSKPPSPYQPFTNTLPNINNVPAISSKLPSPNSCQIITAQNGYIYPLGSPGDECYRFQSLGRSDVCGMAVRLEQMNIPGSPGCGREFISMGSRGPRYCGNNVPQQTVIMDRGECFYARVGRNADFRAAYQSLECGCDATFKQREVAIKGPTGDACTYNFIKTNQDVCGLEITLENLDLQCQHESLYVAGKYYCGQVFKETIQVDFLASNYEIRYDGRRAGSRGKYMIVARELSNCRQSYLSDRNSLQEPPCLIILSRERGNIESSTHQQNTGSCVYRFTVPPDVCWIRMDFDTFNFPWSGNCEEFYMRINGIKYCGNQLAKKAKVIEINRGLTEVNYKSFPQSHWNFTYTQLPCMHQVLTRNVH